MDKQQDQGQEGFEFLALIKQELQQEGEEEFEFRRVWDNEDQQWYYSITDFIKYITNAVDPTTYWANFKKRKERGKDRDEDLIGVFTLTKWKVLRARDGKRRETECVTRLTMLRIAQSLPGEKAEKVRWLLAQLGDEKFQEIEQQSEEEALQAYYKKQGRAPEWIEARLRNLVGRNGLTDEWTLRGAKKNLHFEKLSYTLHTLTFGVSPSIHHQDVKGLPKSTKSPRDHYTEAELGVQFLTELASRQRHQQNDSQGFEELLEDTHIAGEFGKQTRLAFELASGQLVVSSQNFLDKGKGNRQKKKLSHSPEDDQPQQKTLLDE